MALSRRSFLKRTAGAVGALAVAPLATQAQPTVPAPVPLQGLDPGPNLGRDVASWAGRSPRDQMWFDEHERILREAGIEAAALVMALVRHSLISRETAMGMSFKEA